MNSFLAWVFSIIFLSCGLGVSVGFAVVSAPYTLATLATFIIPVVLGLIFWAASFVLE